MMQTKDTAPRLDVRALAFEMARGSALRAIDDLPVETAADVRLDAEIAEDNAAHWAALGNAEAADRWTAHARTLRARLEGLV